MIGIDKAHADLIEGLVKSFKPNHILELGYGDGVSHDAIARGALYNQNKPHYTLVDSWHDWNYSVPEGVHAKIRTHVSPRQPDNTFESISLVTSTEKDFVNTALDKGMQFDFIMSDAHHQESHNWALQVYDKMLASPGIMICHDTSGGYPGLQTIKPELERHYSNVKAIEFNRASREGEETNRGMLVIYKP